MMPPVFTIIIPLFRQPNFLAQCLAGLAKHSAQRHRILVVWSDWEALADNPFGDDTVAKAGEYIVRDWVVNPAGQRERMYDSVQDYIARNGQWLADHDVTFYDVTSLSPAFRAAHGPWISGVSDGKDIAFKDNLGIEKVETDWVIPNWDADFFAGPQWDAHLWDAVGTTQSEHERVVYCPMHIQPYIREVMPVDWHPWRDSPSVACNVLQYPITNPQASVDEQHFLSWWERWKLDEVAIEPCGVRRVLHYLPLLYRTQQLRELVGPYSYCGTGYEVIQDDRLGQLGFMKYGARSSCILHKGFIAGIVQ